MRSIAYCCVLFAAVLPYLTVGIAKARGRYDNTNPRAPETYTGLALRAHSAHQNGLEVLSFFVVHHAALARVTLRKHFV